MTPGSADVSGRSPGTREPGSDRSTPAAAATTSVRLDSLIGSLLKTTHRGQHRDVNGHQGVSQRQVNVQQHGNGTVRLRPRCGRCCPLVGESEYMPRHPIDAAPVESLRVFASTAGHYAHVQRYRWWRGTVVERRSLAGELSLPALDLQLMGDH